MNTQTLVDLAIRQIVKDISFADYTAIQELLEALPPEVLENFIGDLDTADEGSIPSGCTF
jgi:hypothetical protein